MRFEWLATAIRHNAESSVGHVVKHVPSGSDRWMMERGVIRSINSFYQLVSCRFQRSQRAIANAVQVHFTSREVSGRPSENESPAQMEM